MTDVGDNWELKYVTLCELHPTEILSVQKFTENKKNKWKVTGDLPIVMQLEIRELRFGLLQPKNMSFLEG